MPSAEASKIIHATCRRLPILYAVASGLVLGSVVSGSCNSKSCNSGWSLERSQRCAQKSSPESFLFFPFLPALLGLASSESLPASFFALLAGASGTLAMMSARKSKVSSA